MSLEKLQEAVRNFVQERDWERYHSPKNLAMGLSVESNELLEIFIWLTEEQSKRLPIDQMAHLRDEIGDVMIHLVNLCNQFHLDPLQCALEKLEKVKVKYPVERVKGKSKKYDEYSAPDLLE